MGTILLSDSVYYYWVSMYEYMNERRFSRGNIEPKIALKAKKNQIEQDFRLCV